MRISRYKPRPFQRIITTGTIKHNPPPPSCRQNFTTSPNPQSQFQSVDSARSYCADLVRNHDYPSHLLTPFLPAYSRDAHLAIRAFNIDTSKIADVVSNPTLGKLRFQFWRQALQDTYSGRPPKEPVAVLLDKVLREDGVRLTLGFFLRVIAGREEYLGSIPYPTLPSLESYSEATYSSLHYLLHESLSPLTSSSALKLDHISSHIGKATGISAILRGTPLLASKGEVVLPLDVCGKHGMRQEDVIRYGGDAKGIREVVFEIATRADAHLGVARRMLAEEVGEEARGRGFAGFLTAVPTALYLERLESVDFNPFHPSLQKREWKLPWRVYWAFTKKMF